MYQRNKWSLLVWKAFKFPNKWSNKEAQGYSSSFAENSHPEVYRVAIVKGYNHNSQT